MYVQEVLCFPPSTFRCQHGRMKIWWCTEPTKSIPSSAESAASKFRLIKTAWREEVCGSGRVKADVMSDTSNLHGLIARYLVLREETWFDDGVMSVLPVDLRVFCYQSLNLVFVEKGALIMLMSELYRAFPWGLRHQGRQLLRWHEFVWLRRKPPN